MNQNEIMEMARCAGFERLGHTDNDWVCAPEDIEAFAKLVAEAEREAIKQIIRETPFSNWFQADVIEAIDKRGQA